MRWHERGVAGQRDLVACITHVYCLHVVQGAHGAKTARAGRRSLEVCGSRVGLRGAGSVGLRLAVPLLASARIAHPRPRAFEHPCHPRLLALRLLLHTCYIPLSALLISRHRTGCASFLLLFFPSAVFQPSSYITRHSCLVSLDASIPHLLQSHHLHSIRRSSTPRACA